MTRDQVLLSSRSAKVRVLPTPSTAQAATPGKEAVDSLSRLRLTVQTLHALGALPRGRYAASNLAAMLDSMACSPVQALAARVQLLRARMLVEITGVGVVCHDIDRPEISASSKRPSSTPAVGAQQPSSGVRRIQRCPLG